MLLRVILIVLVVLVLLRALARLAVRVTAALGGTGSGAPGTRGGSVGATGRGAPRQRRHLVQCPACGTYFESGRGLPALWPDAAGETAPMVCSEACRRADPSGSASA